MRTFHIKELNEQQQEVKERKIQSAFHPVQDNIHYVIISTESTDSKETKESKDSKETVQEKEKSIRQKKEKKPQKNERVQKRKWTEDEKQTAIRLARTMGVHEAISHLTSFYSDIFSNLSTSTLNYWLHQENRKPKPNQPK